MLSRAALIMPRMLVTSGQSSEPSPENVRAAIAWYHEIAADLASANGRRRAWWYNWLSCRDLFNQKLADRLARVLAADGEGAVIACDDGYAAAVIIERFTSRGSDVRLSVVARLQWICARWWHRLDLARRVFVELRWQLQSLRAARRSSRAHYAEQVDVILVTLFHEHNLRGGKQAYVDSYFGDLPDRLKMRGLRPLVIGSAVGPPEAMVGALTSVREFPVQTFFFYLNLRDILIAWTTAACTRLRFPDGAGFESRGLRALIRTEAARTRPHVARVFLMERACLRLLAQYPNATVMQLCENNVWERAMIMAARKRGQRVVGYMHNPVFPGNAKLTASHREWGLRPDPSSVICTGPAARDALLALKGYPPERVVAGCALRLAPDQHSEIVVRPGNVTSILVLLNGLPKMELLLCLLERSSASLPSAVRIIVRGHPNAPLERLATVAGIKIGAGTRLEPCASPTLTDAINAADCVIYASSGAAFAAARRGLPLIHYARDNAINEDPLFMRPDLRKVMKEPADLATLISDFDARDFASRTACARELAAYARSYLIPPDENSLAVFWGVAGREAAA